LIETPLVRVVAVSVIAWFVLLVLVLEAWDCFEACLKSFPLKSSRRFGSDLDASSIQN